MSVLDHPELCATVRSATKYGQAGECHTEATDGAARLFFACAMPQPRHFQETSPHVPSRRRGAHSGTISQPRTLGVSKGTRLGSATVAAGSSAREGPAPRPGQRPAGAGCQPPPRGRAVEASTTLKGALPSQPTSLREAPAPP